MAAREMGIVVTALEEGSNGGEEMGSLPALGFIMDWALMGLGADGWEAQLG